MLVGPIFFTPFGAPVPEPTLQAHVRNPPIRWLPLELAFRKKLPGYHGKSMSGAWFFGRKDVLKPKKDEILIHGATPVELWMVTAEPMAEGAVFLIRNGAPENSIVVDLGGDRRVLEFAGPLANRTETLELFPKQAPKLLEEGKRTVFAYRLWIEAETGFIPNAARNARQKDPVNDFYQGAAVTFLGTQEELERDLFAVAWGVCDIPEVTFVDEVFNITTRLSNTSSEIWPATGTTRVNLSYRWLDTEGRPVVADGVRTPLPADVRPDTGIEVEQTVHAPAEPGNRVLEIDLVRERVSWFSQKRHSEPCRATVRVLAEPATEYSPEP
jgi:hypothetical protein